MLLLLFDFSPKRSLLPRFHRLFVSIYPEPLVCDPEIIRNNIIVLGRMQGGGYGAGTYRFIVSKFVNSTEIIKMLNGNSTINKCSFLQVEQT